MCCLYIVAHTVVLEPLLCIGFLTDLEDPTPKTLDTARLVGCRPVWVFLKLHVAVLCMFLVRMNGMVGVFISLAPYVCLEDFGVLGAE